MPKYAIKVTPETLPLCEFVHGSPLPHIHGEFYFFVNTDMRPGEYSMGSLPAENVRKHPPITILTPEVVE